MNSTPTYLPTPEQVEAERKAINEAWTPKERRSRIVSDLDRRQHWRLPVVRVSAELAEVE